MNLWWHITAAVTRASGLAPASCIRTWTRSKYWICFSHHLNGLEGSTVLGLIAVTFLSPDQRGQKHFMKRCVMDRLGKPNNHDTKWCIIHWYDIHIKFNVKVNELVRRLLRGPQIDTNPKPETCISLQTNYRVLKLVTLPSKLSNMPSSLREVQEMCQCVLAVALHTYRELQHVNCVLAHWALCHIHKQTAYSYAGCSSMWMQRACGYY